MCRQRPFCTSRRVINCILEIQKLVFSLLLKVFVKTLERVLLKRFWCGHYLYFIGIEPWFKTYLGAKHWLKHSESQTYSHKKGIQFWVIFEKDSFGVAELSPASNHHYTCQSRKILNIDTKYLIWITTKKSPITISLQNRTVSFESKWENYFLNHAHMKHNFFPPYFACYQDYWCGQSFKNRIFFNLKLLSYQIS